MASETTNVTVVEASPPPTFSWGPVWAGFFMVAALQIVLQLFGIAVGITALGPSPRSLGSMSIWSAVWIAISTLSAFFFGGWFAAALARPERGAESTGYRRLAVARGLAVWAFATTMGVLLMTAGLGLGGAINVARALLLPLGHIHALAGGSPSYAIGAAWASFGTLVLSLVCSLTGARLGSGGRRSRRERRVHGHPAAPVSAT